MPVVHDIVVYIRDVITPKGDHRPPLYTKVEEGKTFFSFKRGIKSKTRKQVFGLFGIFLLYKT